MKRIVNRGLAVLLSVIMLVGIIPAGISSAAAADTGKWKFAEWPTGAPVEAQDGWITPDEDGNGFVLDFEKVIADRTDGGDSTSIVLYDSEAEPYKNSIFHTNKLDVDSKLVPITD